MSSLLLIVILWQGPFSYEYVVNNLHDENNDRGVYQIYGYHEVFGSNSLLYIGKTEKQTFSERFSQHKWIKSERGISVYIGRLNPEGIKDVNQAIDSAEELLIYVHQPPYNASDLHYKGKYTKQNIRIFNDGERADLLPELSTEYWRRE